MGFLLGRVPLGRAVRYIFLLLQEFCANINTVLNSKKDATAIPHAIFSSPIIQNKKPHPLG